MRVSISNIAWDATEDAVVASLLGQHGIDAIDVAHSKYFQNPEETTETEIKRVRNWWADRGIEIIGMQALLFGTTGLNVFGSSEIRSEMLRHLRQICRIGETLGAKRLVFGSPKNRDRSGLSDELTDTLAKTFFWDLGEIAKVRGVTICLEPNPSIYSCNFMTTSDETARIVRLVDHPSIRMQLDTGALTINNEEPQDIVRRHADIIAHIHASEPQLVTLGDGATDHSAMARAIASEINTLPVTIEMVASTTAPHLQAIEQALNIAKHHYANAGNR
jgi:D-psicose/D-tagatose/L-ribulose 3-epimerase